MSCCCNQSHVTQKGNPDKIPSKIIKKVPPRLRIMNHFLDLAPAVRASQPTPSTNKTHPALARSHLPGSERGGASWKKISPRGYFVTFTSIIRPRNGTFGPTFRPRPHTTKAKFHRNRVPHNSYHTRHRISATFDAPKSPKNAKIT